MELVFWAMSFCATVIGGICGIGGGVIIKPVLNASGVMSVSAISFLSGCTVLSMSCYSVIKSRISKESVIDMGISTFLGIGAIIGGIAGKQLFHMAERMFENPNMAGVFQSAILALVTIGTLIYTICKKRISTLTLSSKGVCITIGLILGVMSSFLGIGGGPINLVALYFFFSMDAKVAAQNSLYIILLSQISSLLLSTMTGTVPSVPLGLLAGMVLSGLLGSAVGRKINSKINNAVVEKLFMGLMCIIILICFYNVTSYMDWFR